MPTPRATPAGTVPRRSPTGLPAATATCWAGDSCSVVEGTSYPCTRTPGAGGAATYGSEAAVAARAGRAATARDCRAATVETRAPSEPRAARAETLRADEAVTAATWSRQRRER